MNKNKLLEFWRNSISKTFAGWDNVGKIYYEFNQCNWNFGILEFSKKIEFPSLDYNHISYTQSINWKNSMVTQTVPCILRLRPRRLDSCLKIWDWDFRIKLNFLIICWSDFLSFEQNHESLSVAITVDLLI